jgi:transcriptional regulator with XRE-family HTH domain
MTEIFLFDEVLTLGQRIRITRIAKRWTQGDLACEASVPQGCVSALERDLKVYPAAKQKILQVLRLLDDQPEASHAE